MLPSESLKRYDSILTIRTSAGSVPVYKVIEKYLYVEDEDGRKVRFTLREQQADLYRRMCEMRMSGRPVRADILKARQIGFSTFIAAVIFVMTIFQPGRRAAIVADVAEHATNLFQKYNFFYDCLPEELRVTKVRSNAKELVVRYANGQTSSIRIMVQGDSAGRSGTYQYLHLSECAFWNDLQDTLTSLLQTVSSTNMDSMVFLETTANGVNEYKQRWDKDVTGRTMYEACFYGWADKYRVPESMLYDYRKPDWLLDLKDELGLDDCQCQWYWGKYNEFAGDLDRLRQEFPSTPNEAFITTGASVFNAELLRRRKDQLIGREPLRKGMFTFGRSFSQDGKRIDITNVQWTESRQGSIRIYEDPVKGHPYVVCNDNANGGEDYYATHVFDNHTGRQVAVYHRNRCDADDAAYQMYCLGLHYNTAMVTGETNTTSYLLQVCQRCGYPFIYQDHDIEDLGLRFQNKLGYKTKQNNRQAMIDMFRIAFREDPTIIADYETLCEMESFQIVKHRNGTEKAEASGGAHDDLVMAACGFFLCRGQQRASVLAEEEHKAMAYDPLSTRKKDNRRVYQIWN